MNGTAEACGVRDTYSVMKVNVMHGSFQKDPNVRNELFRRLGEKQGRGPEQGWLGAVSPPEMGHRCHRYKDPSEQQSEQ